MGTATGGTGFVVELGGTSSVGGESSMGGASTSVTGGASSTGGVTTTGGTSALTCTATYTSPAANQALSNSDDANGNCNDGIQYNVVVATNAPDGTAATLWLTPGTGDTTQLAATTVASAVARFTGVTLPASGQITLTTQIAGGACSAAADVSLSCADAPGCTITSPTISAAHPALNGVSSPQGDRVSSIGAPYQVAFEISTDVQDGQPVVLTVDGSTNYQTTASAGKARFGGVLMVPDGNHTAQASCTARSGLSSTTAQLTYPVDTVAPDLTPQKGTGTTGTTLSTLNNGDHYAASDDADPAADGLQIRFCGASTATDAVDIPAANPNANNFCVKRGNNAPTCAPVLTANGDSNPGGNFGCVNVDCPGDGPFSIDLSVTDAAGNPTTVTRTGITCASTNPTVTFIDPISDSGQFTDISRRILAANNNNPETVRRDANPSRAGAQYDVIACTSAPAGSTAILHTGYQGQPLNQTATTTVVAESSGTPICPGGNLITFSSSVVTLPESLTNSSFNISTPTELRISVTDLNLAVGSAIADVWVDSVSPALTLTSPSPFCGQYFNTGGSDYASVNLVFGSSVPVTVSVAGSSGTQTFTGTNVVFSQVTVGVQLPTGTDSVSARASKPSTNYGVFPACEVTVGSTPPPSVSWTQPITTSLLTAAGNTGENKIPDSSASAGWQGDLKVCTDIDVASFPGTTLAFSATVGTTITTLGTADLVADASCPNGKTSSATLAGASVPEADNVILTATTSAILGSTGTASITVPVSATAPGQAAITTVEITDRRRTSFTPRWTAPAGNVAGYRVRVAKTAIATQAEFDAALDIPYTGSGICPSEGCSVLVDKCTRNSGTGEIFNCYVENDYYFAVAAVDSVGNQGPLVATTSPTRAKFEQTELLPEYAQQRFGAVLDGTGDFNNDGYSDLVISYAVGNEVDIFFGSSTGVATVPTVRIQGSVTQFGGAVAAIGDINKDGFQDLAIGSARDGAGKVSVYYGRSTADWNSKPALTTADANCRISVDSSETDYAAARLGLSIVRLGDYNGDQVDDFAVSAYAYKGSTGFVAVVFGIAATSGGLPAAISLPNDFGTGVMRIDGDVAGARFGFTMLGLSQFYGGASTSALLVGAPYYNTNAGRVYAFTGASAVPVTAASAANTLTGSTGEFFGFYGINPLGNLGPGGQLALGLSVVDASPSRVDAYSGTAAAGPFNVRASFSSSEISSNQYGRAVVGGGVSGTSDTFSLVGTKGGRSDLAVTTRANSTPRLYIVDGDKIVMPQASTVESIADVVVPLKGTFGDFARFVTAIPDLDKDGYGDLVVAETDYGASPTSGHVLVLR